MSVSSSNKLSSSALAHIQFQQQQSFMRFVIESSDVRFGNNSATCAFRQQLQRQRHQRTPAVAPARKRDETAGVGAMASRVSEATVAAVQIVIGSVFELRASVFVGPTVVRSARACRGAAAPRRRFRNFTLQVLHKDGGGSRGFVCCLKIPWRRCLWAVQPAPQTAAAPSGGCGNA